MITNQLFRTIESVEAYPDEDNMLQWNFLLQGLSDSPYNGGLYLGQISLKNDYPLSAPSIKFLTPNGRFEQNSNICMSNTGFHQELWSAGWNIRSILISVLSAMMDDSMTGVGHIRSSTQDRKKMALDSKRYNEKHYAKTMEGFTRLVLNNDVTGSATTTDATKDSVAFNTRSKSSNKGSLPTSTPVPSTTGVETSNKRARVNDDDMVLDDEIADSIIKKSKPNEDQQKNVEKEYSKLICPLTQHMFSRPVVAQDGHIYEEDAILGWHRKSQRSPITNAQMNNLFIKAPFVQQKVATFLKENPEFSTMLYEQVQVQVTDMSYIHNKEAISDHRDNNHFDLFKQYDKFVLSDIWEYVNSDNEPFVETVMRECNDKSVIKHVFSKCVDINCKSSVDEDHKGWQPIHYVCNYPDKPISHSIIKHILRLGANPWAETEAGQLPIHIAYASTYTKNKEENAVIRILSNLQTK